MQTTGQTFLELKSTTTESYNMTRYEQLPDQILLTAKHRLALSLFYSKLGFWPSCCQISNDLDKILHTPNVVRNTLVGRLRPPPTRGRLQA